MRLAAIGSIQKPRFTGLSAKVLGMSEYQRQLRLWKIEHGLLPRPVQIRWTGLSTKILTHAEYNREFRKLQREQGRA